MTPSQQFAPASWQPEMAILAYRLDNGLTLLVLPDYQVPVVSVQVHYKVGSRHERPGITGISHLFEHLMFRGTETLGPEEFSRILQAKGGEINAFTTRDHTSYFENLPAEHLELALRLEADRLRNLKLNEENFQTERQVVVSERKLRAVDNPFGLVLEQLFATAYTQHPYTWPVIGWDQDLRRLTLEDCLAYYRASYHPGNMAIVLSGDVRPETALELVSRYFGEIPSPGPPALAKVTEPPQRGERRAVFKKVSQVEALFAGYHIVGMGHPDIYPLSILAIILSGGKSSRFYQEFVRPGRAVDMEMEVAAPPWASEDPDLAVISAVAAPGQPLGELEAALWEQLERLRTEGVQLLELARAQKLIRAQIVQALAKNFYRGLLAGLFYLKTGAAAGANQLLRHYDSVTLDDLLRVARQYLREDNRTVVTLKPVSPEESQALGAVA
jgi:zinc protease